jgi:hypothetical protein
MEEILNRPKELGRPAIVVIDPHGEYVGFGDDEGYITSTKIFNERNISIATNRLDASKLAELAPKLTPVQRRELYPIIAKLQKQKAPYTFDHLIDQIEKSAIAPRTSGPIISWLLDLNSTGLFGKFDSPAIDELARPGQLSIFDLSGCVRLRDRQIILTYFARRLFEERRAERVPPFILFIEEAHQFAPQHTEKVRAVSRGIIEQIAREGRKFNACLVLISQRPIHLSTTALSQCNTHIILRVTNPYDLDHIGRSSEGITRDVLGMIPGLKVGEALVVGEAVNYPILLKVRERVSKQSAKGKRLEIVLKEYVEKKRLEREDVKTFM